MLRTNILPLLPEWRLIERLCAYLDHIVHQGELPLGHPYRSYSRYLTHLRASGELQDPLRQFITDKEHAKLYVKAMVGDEFNVPTLMVTSSTEEASAFSASIATVAKPTHASGHVKVMCPDETLSQPLAEYWLSMNFYRSSREANYRHLRPKIIFEKMLDEDGRCPDDYKVYCFHGKPNFIRVILDRFGAGTAVVYDTDWNRLNFTNNVKRRNGPDVPRPHRLDEICQVAAKLAQPFDSIRVDIYQSGGEVYVGEITNCPGGGHESFSPRKVDELVGRLLRDSGLTLGQLLSTTDTC